MIRVQALEKHYDYYKKEEGLKNSLKNLLHREKLVKEAVKGITFSVSDGEMVGFIGPNGAGKTTTLKMLSGILYPTAGTASVNGYTPWERKKAFQMSIAMVMGQKSQLNWDLPANETFYLNKCIYELSEADYRKNLSELCEALAVSDLTRVQVRRLSLGERMKMELIAALLHHPRVLFLDEPTIGLDIISQKSIREFIRYYNKTYGATVLLTSHYMDDIRSLCRRALIISDGHLVYDGDLSGVCDRISQNKTIRVTFEKAIDDDALSRYGDVQENDGFHAALSVARGDIRARATLLLENLPVTDLTIEELPIEDAISALYRGGAQ